MRLYICSRNYGKLLSTTLFIGIFVSSCGNGRANTDARQTLISSIFNLRTGLDDTKWTREQIEAETWKISIKEDGKNLLIETPSKIWNREEAPNISRVWRGNGNLRNLTNIVIVDVQIVDSVMSKNGMYTSPVVAIYERHFANLDPYKLLLFFSGFDGTRSGYYYFEERFIPKSFPTKEGNVTKWVRVRVEFHIDENNIMDFENQTAQMKIKDIENSVTDDIQKLLIDIHRLRVP